MPDLPEHLRAKRSDRRTSRAGQPPAWLEYRGLPPETTLAELIRVEREAAAHQARFEAARATDPGPAVPTTPLHVAQQLRDAMIGQHEAAGHVLEVHALGTEECAPCQHAADECSGDKACDRWKAWQAQYEAAMVLPLSTVPPAGPESIELQDGQEPSDG